VQTTTANLSLFGVIPIKEIEVNKIAITEVIPLGNTVGIKIYTEGVLVVGMGEIEGQEPHLDSGIEEGDVIKKINGQQISSAKELIATVNLFEGETVEIKYVRDGEERITEITPVMYDSGEYKLGLWVRDGAARNWDNNIL